LKKKENDKMKNDVKKPVKIKKPIRQKIIVEQGRVLIGTPIPYKVLYTEIVESEEIAKIRVQELKEEYKDVEAVSINYFSL
jgi:hypothetical protein